MSASITFSKYLDAARQGDKHAFTELVTMLNSTVSSIALAITKDLQHSQDVSQIVFTKLWQQLDQLNNDQSVLPWVRQITRYSAINYLRDKKITSEQAYDEENIETLLSQVCEHPDQDNILIKAQQSQVIAHLLEQLPDESREIVLLYYRQEHNAEVVAQLLELSPTTVRKRLQRVRGILKEQVLARYGKVIFASAPIGLATALATTAMSATPVAAATLSSSLAASQSHWLTKLATLIGGAGIGGILALLANNFAIGQTLKNIDNEQDVSRLQQIKTKLNIVIILSCLMLGLSYQFTHGWLAPVATYTIFSIGLLNYIRIVNTISQVNLQRKALSDSSYLLKIERSKIYCRLGLVFGIGGGWGGFLYGLIVSGRFDILI